MIKQLTILIISISISFSVFASIGCSGRIVNPITDVCWKCLFPIRIAGVKIVGSNMPDEGSPREPICFCKRPGIPVPVPGIPISFWEPVRLVDVTKSPMCMVGLGGIKLGDSLQKGFNDDTEGTSFYHLHWYVYPVLYWLEILMDFVCLEMASVDIAWLTEYDPLWGDDAKSNILNPEALLFAAKSVVTAPACVADCVAASSSLPLDLMHWCAGCWGTLYPFTGTISHFNGGVGASQLIAAKFIARMHRQLSLWGYCGKEGMCGKYPMPIIKKSQYRLQMTFPVPERSSCKRIGQTEATWQAGREFPVKGEDFGYLIWRKRDCCSM